MPAKSPSQRRLMMAAMHGADFPKAKAVRRTMTDKQLREFATKRGVTGESHSYDWRQRDGLKRGRG